jgi:hypothetical protein
MYETIEGLLDICKEEKDLPFLDEVLPDFPELVSKDIKQIRYYCKNKLKNIQELAKAFKQSEDFEIEGAVINLWFELRSEWIRYNSVNNYNMIFHGTANPMYIIQSSFVSFLIGKIEKYIPPEKLEQIQQIMLKVQYNE